MEYWSRTSVPGYSNTPALQYSNTPARKRGPLRGRSYYPACGIYWVNLLRPWNPGAARSASSSRTSRRERAAMTTPGKSRRFIRLPPFFGSTQHASPCFHPRQIPSPAQYGIALPVNQVPPRRKVSGVRRAFLQSIPLLGALPALTGPAGAAPDLNARKGLHGEFRVPAGTKSPEEEEKSQRQRFPPPMPNPPARAS